MPGKEMRGNPQKGKAREVNDRTTVPIAYEVFTQFGRTPAGMNHRITRGSGDMKCVNLMALLLTTRHL